jgi:hypothetical protein
MIAALIFVLSFTALLQFFVSYCRSILSASRERELSRQTRELTGIAGGGVNGEEFRRLVQLVRLCPEHGDDGQAMAAVRIYYSLLGMIRRAGGRASKSISNWLESERGSCAYFAAVSLDRRIAFSRELMARQMMGHS